MERINLNLLPEEFLIEKKLGTKRSLYLRISIIIFVTVLILTSTILLVRLTQSQALGNLEGDLEGSKTNIVGLKENETAVFMLKNRLDKISQISSKESIPVQGYNLFSSIIPAGANVTSFSMLKENIINASVETTDTTVLDELFTKLLDPETNNGQITTIKLENIRLQGDKITVEMTIGYAAKPAVAPKST